MQNPWPAATWPSPDSASSPGDDLPPALLRAAQSVNARSSIHGPDVLFLETSTSTSPPVPPRPQEDGLLRRARTVPGHPYAASPPVIPPKPSLDTRFPRRVSEPPQRSHPDPPQLPLPPPPPLPLTEPTQQSPEPPRAALDDDAELAELAAVIALSQAETLRQEKLKLKMLSQEEADFKRAMEASLSSNSWSAALGRHSIQGGPSNGTVLSPIDAEFPQDAYMDDETFARMLAAQENPTPTQTSFPPVNGNGSEPDAEADGVYPSAPGTGLAADEKFALQLAAEEEKLARKSQDKPPEEPPDIPVDTKPSLLGFPKLDPSDLPRIKSAGAELLTWIDKSMESPTQPMRPASVDAATFRSTAGLLSPSESLSVGTPSSEESDGGRSITANQYVDSDLLRGVSIGFVAPFITSDLVPLQGSMPNIVSLPYGRCPPLHLQAPSWRHLLKLMARLSGTRFEPTVEALAVARSSQMHLRTVVQFVRLHHTTTDWRTVLWFTIDHPVPGSMPNSRKYTNGDVDVLPWSYTLSSLPALLRDSSDTPLSKCYTIPATTNVPFPALPISFPNMALYLQAALEESRRFTSDSSSGMRKLAKMVETCYPAASDSKSEDERSRMGGLLKKFRGGRKDKGRKGKGGGNEDTYELVTPFVLDEWGQSERYKLVTRAFMATQTIVPLTTEEEDQIILARITNDERPLRRVIKKLYNYTALAHPPIVPQIPAPGSSTPAPSADDAREAFLVELASFRLMLRKSVMICEAEARQVEEYQREKERIDLEHGTLRGRIEQLKTGLEHEQMLRRRKIEYDFVAEKVNSLPSREELELSIQALENDMSTIRAEHEAQDRSILAQTISLDQIIKNLEALRSLGRGDQEIAAGADMTPRDSPGPEGSGDAPTAVPEVETAVPEKMEVEEGEEESVGPSKEDGEGDDDIEMGEVEEPKKGKKKREEELEEGEASDGSDLSSVLSDVPDHI